MRRTKATVIYKSSNNLRAVQLLLARPQQRNTGIPIARESGRRTSPDATLTLTKPLFVKMIAGTAGVKDTLFSDDLKISGSKIDLVRFFSLIDKPAGTFGIVTR